MDPIAIATDIIEDNQLVAVGLVVALFSLTLVPRLAVVAVKRAGEAIVKFAKGKG